MNPHPPAHPAVALAQTRYHAETVAEVQAAVAKDDFVVVGMGWNPSVGRARRLLDGKGKTHTYLGYGNYLSGWRKRLAIKLWSGWPTYPQVFVHGVLIGGASDLKKLIDSGEFETLVEKGRS